MKKGNITMFWLKLKKTHTALLIKEASEDP
jgi:hypothetical protein